MNHKLIIFVFIISVLVLSIKCQSAFASDVVTETDNSVESTEEVTDVEVSETYDFNLIYDSIHVNNDKLDLIYYEIKSVSALLLILVVFETLKIVRSWTKGIGVK